ncbi:MAG: 50S ribosomal protein L12 [Candidatus Odinarchaeota archaeon]
MMYVHAALLLHSAGQPINESNLKKVVAASGAKADDSRIKALLAVLEGVNIDEALKSAVSFAAPAAAPAAAHAAAPAAAEKKEEPAEESGDDLGLDSLFG